MRKTLSNFTVAVFFFSERWVVLFENRLGVAFPVVIFFFKFKWLVLRKLLKKEKKLKVIIVPLSRQLSLPRPGIDGWSGVHLIHLSLSS